MPVYTGEDKLNDHIEEICRTYSPTREFDQTAQILNPHAGKVDQRDVSTNDITPIYLITWDSTYFSYHAEDNLEADSLLIFREKATGFWGYYEYVCAGYSSYTFVPEEDCRIYQTTDWDTFVNIALTETQRQELGYIQMERDVLGYKPENSNG